MNKVGNKIECNNMHGERIKIVYQVGINKGTDKVLCSSSNCVVPY